MVTLALDIDDLLQQGTQAPASHIAPGSFVGHVHMKVSDVARANDFYRDSLGFEEQASIPSAAFLSAGGYHHHVGLNSWQSQGSNRAPEDTPGLREVGFRLASGQALDTLAEQAAGSDSLARDDSGRLLRDPDGQLLSFST